MNVEKEELMKMGLKTWEESYAKATTDREAFDMLCAWLGKVNPAYLAIFLASPADQQQTQWSARWADCGFPQVVLGHKYAAALMATHIPEDVLPQVRPPWPAFLIELPDSMLYILDEKNNEVALRRVLLHHVKDSSGNEVWQYVATSDGRTRIYRHGIDTCELALTKIKNLGMLSENDPFKLPLDSLDERTSQLLGRLIVGTCLSMSDPTNVRAHAKAGAVGSVGRQGQEPSARTFRVGKPIEIDVREALDAFVHGRVSRTPTAQALVRGHWKPRLAERVGHPVWIHPYWRGPIDAPVLVRPHVLGEKERRSTDA